VQLNFPRVTLVAEFHIVLPVFGGHAADFGSLLPQASNQRISAALGM
jgi:hypothetical protein